MEFQDNFRFCSSSEVHVSGVFYFMTYRLSFSDRIYLFDFYELQDRYYLCITCNGHFKYFEVSAFYFKSLRLGQFDMFCLDCVHYLY